VTTALLSGFPSKDTLPENGTVFGKVGGGTVELQPARKATVTAQATVLTKQEIGIPSTPQRNEICEAGDTNQPLNRIQTVDQVKSRQESKP